MNPGRTFATAGRVLRQLSHDGRSVALMLIAPSLLVGLFSWLFVDQPQVFQDFGPPILALFPFIVMFLITSITTLRERRSGTLEPLGTIVAAKGVRPDQFTLAQVDGDELPFTQLRSAIADLENRGETLGTLDVSSAMRADFKPQS